MAYQVIARKWRPQKFSDMVGQEHLARTLRNAIITDRTAHAYLFVGPRGIGKTTTARIFAKALNCEHPIDGEPCCQCESCRAIAEERNVDVIEIDAATHTQVDKARELCEDVLTLPIHSRYKIYIIDEVHMLSTAAWNALLKTIEEPPAHAKFIFATTEVNKVLPTVISRCQRFDLKRIKTPDIAGRLRLICDTEKVKICDEALQIIARAADGGMRDAQSLLDQVISFFGTGNGEEITEAQTLSLFGLAASDDMVDLVKAMLTNDRSTAIKMIWQFAEAGKNLEILYEEVISWLRCTLLSGIVDNPTEIIDEGAEKASLYMNLASLAKTSVIQRLLEQLAASAYQLREALNKQVFMEAIVLKAMRLAHAVQIEDLIARLTQLRTQGDLNAVGSVVPLYEMPAGQIVVPKDYCLAPAVNRNREMKVISADEAKKMTDAASNAIGAVASAPAVQSVQQPAELQKKNDLSNVPPSPQVAKEVPAQVPKVEPKRTVAPAPVVYQEPTAVPVAPAPQNHPMQADNIPSMDADDVEVVDDYDMLPPEDDETPVRATYHNAEQIWDSLIIDVRDCLKMAGLASAMEEGTPTGIYRGTLTVVFDEEYERMQHTIVGNDVVLLERRLKEVSGGTVYRLNLDLQAGFATPQQVEKRVNTEKLREDILHNPFIRQTIQQFSGTLTDVFAEEELKNDQKES